MSEPKPDFLLLTDVSSRVGIDYLVARSAIKYVQRVGPRRQLVVLDGDGPTFVVELSFAFLARLLGTVDPIAILAEEKGEPA